MEIGFGYEKRLLIMEMRESLLSAFITNDQKKILATVTVTLIRKQFLSLNSFS